MSGLDSTEGSMWRLTDRAAARAVGLAVAALLTAGPVLAQAARTTGPALPASPAAPAAEQRQPGAEDLSAGRNAAMDGRWQEALDHFRSILDRFPDGALADDATFWSAQSLHELGRYEEAVETATAFIERYPGSDLLQDARVVRLESAEALVRQGNADYERYLRDEAAPRSPRGPARPAGVPRASPGSSPAPVGAPRPGQSAGVPAGSQVADPDSELRLYALDALVSMDPEQAWPLLRRIMTESDDPELRHRGMWLLSEVGTDEAFDLLVQMARSDADAEVRRNALLWVAQSGEHSEQALDLLIELATSGTDDESRQAAIFGLSQIDDPRARQMLEDLARDAGLSTDHRASALFFLAQQSDGSLAVLRDIALNDPDLELRKQALFGISQIETQEASDFLLEIARSDGPTDFRSSAIFWLSQRADDRAIDVLIELWGESVDLEVKNQLLFAMSQIGSERAIDHIIAVANDDAEDQELRKQAVFWLGQSEHPKAKAALLEIIGDSLLPGPDR